MTAYDADEPPRMEGATQADLLLAMRACGSLAPYGGFVRVALAAIYAERARAAEVSEDTGVYARYFFQTEDGDEVGPFERYADAATVASGDERPPTCSHGCDGGCGFDATDPCQDACHDRGAQR